MAADQPGERLTITGLATSARDFLRDISAMPIPALYGVTDGKAVGTFVELAFHQYLKRRFSYVQGNAASGISSATVLLSIPLCEPEGVRPRL